MTVPAGNDRIAGPFTATGGETALAFDFRVLEAGDVAVWRKRSGAIAQLVLNTDYSVSGVGAEPGGTALLTFPAVAGDQYVLAGNRRRARTSDLVYAKALPDRLLNTELDALEMQIVELNERIDRALLRSIFDGPEEAPLVMPPFRANTVLGFGDDKELVLFDRDPLGSLVPQPASDDFLIKDRDLSTPPVSPAIGDQYLVKPPGTGAWSSKTGKMRWNGTAWVQTEYVRGQLFVIEDEQEAFVWNGAVLKNVMGRGVRDVFAGDLDPGNSAAANAAVMNAAIARAAELGGARIVTPRGRFYTDPWNSITSASTVVQGVERWVGGTEFFFSGTSGNCIVIDGPAHCGLRNVYISSDGKRTGGAAVKVQGGSYGSHFEHCRVDYHYAGFDIGASAATRISNVDLRYIFGGFGVRGYVASGGGVYGLSCRDMTCDTPYLQGFGTVRTWSAGLTVSLGDIVVADNKIYQCDVAGTTGSVAPSGIPGTVRNSMFTTRIADGSASWVFVCSIGMTWMVMDSNCYSMSASDCELISGALGFLQTDTANTGGSYPKWFNSFNLEIDHPYSDCVRLEKGQTFQGTEGWWGSSLTGNGIWQKSTHRGDVLVGEGTRIFGNWFHGVLAEGPSTKIKSATIAANSQVADSQCHGVLASSTSRGLIVSGSHIGRDPDGSGRQLNGVRCAAGSDEWIVHDNNLLGNAGTSFVGTTSATCLEHNNLKT